MAENLTKITAENTMNIMAGHSPVGRLYDPLVRDAREDFARRPVAASMLSRDADPVALERCLISFCAYGVAMTEPVEGWIRRAAVRCAEIGLQDLARALREHAAHEAGHHHMMIADTRKLVERWNARRTPALDVNEVLARELPAGVLQYSELHERTIAGDAPYGQLAIEYEIEGLSVRFGPAFLDNCQKLLGAGILSGLSFLVEHVELDVGHTAFNRRQLETLLTRHPGFARPLARSGSDALAAYAAFLEDCWEGK